MYRVDTEADDDDGDKTDRSAARIQHHFIIILAGWKVVHREKSTAQLVRLHMSSPTCISTVRHLFTVITHHHSLQYIRRTYEQKSEKWRTIGRRCARSNQSSLFHFF